MEHLAPVERAPQRIIDGHCHVASLDFIPPSFVDGSVDNIACALRAQGVRFDRAKLHDLYLSYLQDPLADELVAQMSQAGIERAVLLLPDFTYALRDCALTIAEMFARHAEILRRHAGRFAVLAGVDPRWGLDGLRLFERGLSEWGFRGLKIYPPCGVSPSDDLFYPYYELCAARRLPVLVHIGGTSPALAFDLARPMFVDKAARDFPTVDFILAHGAVAYVEECVMMCACRPNVFLDLSGCAGAPGAAVQRVLGHNINHKVIFGTDWPVFRQQGRQRDLVEALVGEGGPLAALRPWERELVCVRTIERLIFDGQALSAGDRGR